MAIDFTELDHAKYMRLAIAEAKKSPPKPTNYCVGAVLVNAAKGTVLATGYTLELPGNTHAEQCCLAKFAQEHSLSEDRIAEVLDPALSAVLYTSMEPCVERLSGNKPCAQRIVDTRKPRKGWGIQHVFTGIREPETFVKANSSRKLLDEADIGCTHISGYEDEILAVATAGHPKTETEAAEQ